MCKKYKQRGEIYVISSYVVFLSELVLQDEKRKMVASAFGEDQTGGSATRLTVEDLKYLFMV